MSDDSTSLGCSEEYRVLYIALFVVYLFLFVLVLIFSILTYIERIDRFVKPKII
jgi:hypothetical protein